MTALDLDAMRAAHPPWEITLDGVAHVAAPIPGERFSAILSASTGADRYAHEPTQRALWRAAYPWRPRYLRKRRDPVWLLMSLDVDIRRALVVQLVLHTLPPMEA